LPIRPTCLLKRSLASLLRLIKAAVVWRLVMRGAEAADRLMRLWPIERLKPVAAGA
jgi:hypothetical protein